MGVDGARTDQQLLTRLGAEMVDRFQAEGFWSSETIYDLAARHCEGHPEAIAVSGSRHALSYRALLALADRIADELLAAGLRPGDRVALWLPSRVEIPIFLLACAREGFILCPSLHRTHTVEEVLGLIEGMQAAAFVGEAGYGADGGERDLFAAIESLGLRRVYKLEPSAAPSQGVPMKPRADDGAAASRGRGRANHIVYLAFTSGTTSEPKGVMHSNNTLLSNARALAQPWGFDRNSVVYSLSPLSHNLGFGAMILALFVGGRLVIHDLPRGASLLGALREVGATFIFGVPAHAMDLLLEIEAAGRTDLPQLKGLRISGAAVPQSVVERLLSYGVTPQTGYGMTEAGSHNFTLPSDPEHRIVNTSGKTCAGYELATFSLDDPNRRQEPGEVGQIGGRGASLMLGYFNDQLSTERSFNDGGWFMTGDLGVIDEDGYVRITGRIKDVIIRGGHNIHPAKIESLAMRHPGVERAAAVPVKDERLGEKVCIVVMPKTGVTIDVHDLLKQMRGFGLSKYDMPEYFLEVEEIPLGATGKILKRSLLLSLERGELVPTPVRVQA